MKKYNIYKKSKIKWIDEIPNGWKIINFRYLIDVLTDFTANGSFGDLAKNVNYLDFGFSRLIRQTDLNAKFENKAIYVDESAHKYLSKSELFGGEVILANVGSAGLSWIFEGYKGKATLGPNCFLLKFNHLLNNKFAYISLNSYYLNSQILDKASSSIQPKLNKEDIRTCKVIVPSLQEQIKITEYIDYKTGLIDSTIKKKRKLIELLKEKRQAVINEAVTKGLNPNAPIKDSGVEWLGKIPEHWETSKLKFLVDENLKYGANESAEDDNPKNPRYIRITDFGDNGVLRENTFKSLEFDIAKEYLLNEGDILFARSGATVGKTFQFKNYDGLACFAGYLIKASVNNKITSDFLYYFTKSNSYENWKNSIFVQATIQNISAEKYNNLIICFPKNREEQLKINKYIETESRKLDSIIKKIETAIEQLQEYRQSIISEAVTGKIDVRDWQLPK